MQRAVAHRGDHQRAEDHQRQPDAPEPIENQATHPALVQQHRGEEAGDHEEQRHAEQVQQPDDQVDGRRLRAIGRGEIRVQQRAVGQRGVEDHPGQHRQRAQVVHVVKTHGVVHGETSERICRTHERVLALRPAFSLAGFQHGQGREGASTPPAARTALSGNGGSAQ
jgi:hypothetical protein